MVIGKKIKKIVFILLILVSVICVGYLLLTDEFDFEKARNKFQDMVREISMRYLSKDKDALYQNKKVVGRILNGDFEEQLDQYYFPHLYDSKDLKFNTIVEFGGNSCLPMPSDFGMADGPMFTRTIGGIQTPALYNVQSVYCKKVGGGN